MFKLNSYTHHHAHHLCLCYSNYIGCRLKQEYTITMFPHVQSYSWTCTDIPVSHVPTRLRSASRGDYILPRSRLRCVDSSFSISAPTAWNNLPAHIRSCTSLSQFLSKLKSHLFITSFPPQYIIPYSPHTLFRFKSFFFLFIFTFI